MKPRTVAGPPRNRPTSTCMEERHNHLSDAQASLAKPTTLLVKRKKRFESMKKLLDIEKLPWSFQLEPQRRVCALVVHQEQEDDDDDEKISFPICQRPPHPKEDHIDEPRKVVVVSQKLTKPRSWKAERVTSCVHHGKVEVSSSVMERAHAVQTNLDPKFPSFIKPMIRSNVTRGFWLSLSTQFCRMHLPRHDIRVTLIDESQTVYNTRYLFERSGLSAGWRGFSIAHNLVEGDVLVFHLVRVCRLKVYIVRANHLGEVDAALSLLHLDAQARLMDPEQPSQDNRLLKDSGKDLHNPSLQEVPYKHHVAKEAVYECLSQDLEGLISETIGIADAIKANKIIPSEGDLAGWKKRSMRFEHIHDGLGYIRARLDNLVFRMLESSEAANRTRYSGAGHEWDYGREMRAFKGKMLELKEATERLNAEVEVLKIHAEMHKITM